MSETIKENRASNRQIKFRVNDSEFEDLQRNAEKLQMSVPAFAKKRALSYRMKPPTIDLVGAREIAKQLMMIGNNINQLTKLAHQSNDMPSLDDLKSFEDQLNQVQNALQEVIE